MAVSATAPFTVSDTFKEHGTISGLKMNEAIYSEESMQKYSNVCNGS
jgi:hypothetical protein